MKITKKEDRIMENNKKIQYLKSYSRVNGNLYAYFTC